jgi:hypothetical protein
MATTSQNSAELHAKLDAVLAKLEAIEAKIAKYEPLIDNPAVRWLKSRKA